MNNRERFDELYERAMGVPVPASDKAPIYGDSLDAVEFVMDLEEEFNIDISDDLPRSTVGDFRRMIPRPASPKETAE